MKKVIFISALAIAAAVSCTKSDIVDTKFNEAIGFETYVGRDAMTKVAPATETSVQGTGFGVYGFYTGTDTYTQGTTKTNLWANDEVSYSAGEWVPATPKYWTNESDQYTFLAYAPYADSETSNGISEMPTELGQVNPSIKFTVNQTLADQVDLLYSNNLTNTTKTKGTALLFKHALSRITVKASEANADYDYTVTAISLAGKFNTTDVLTLADGVWATNGAAATATEIYSITTTSVNVPDTRTAGTVAHDFAGTDKSNYLMVIPTNLTGDNASVLSVTYTTTFDGHTSNPMTKTLPIAINFQEGKAYSINLVFEPNTTDLIKFTVTVDAWRAEGEGAADNSETEVPGGNPVTGTPVA